MITGFDTSATTTFGTQKCSSYQSVVQTVLGTSHAPIGQAVISLNTNGSLRYGDVNYWNKTGNDISYTGTNFGIGTTTPAYKLDINGEVINNGFYRSRGTTGWYNETYGGGVYMTDTSFVRTYGNKAIAASSFYDQDNMGFYLNPDSISRTNRINFFHAYNIDDGNYYLDPSWASRFNYLGRNYGFNWTEYDWNDTSYYVDQNNTSSFNAVYAHTFLYHPDRRLKKNIVPVSHSLDKITSLTGYTFDWIRDGTPDIGIIA
ncbi:shufflon system plasmid conjugative transfer pilus tip adhesin PilV [Candidatus Gracilibacteria bacterium]|nr:shufflon system plasmid conjugative transfer pilus tip adhesin PilV [Candidatus Gracilibacteria bacterium]